MKLAKIVGPLQDGGTLSLEETNFDGEPGYLIAMKRSNAERRVFALDDVAAALDLLVLIRRASR